MRQTAGGWKCAIAVGLCAALGIAGPAQAAEQTYPTKGPGGNKFYKPPKELPKGHGALIWQRKATGITPVAGAKNRLVLYTSKTPQGKATAVSGIVSVPKGKPPQGGWPVISFAHGTTGTADPARRPGRPGSPQAPYIDLHRPRAAGLDRRRLRRRSHRLPGPRHSWPAPVSDRDGRGPQRRRHRHRRARALSAGKKYLISGHSQGGQSALFAAGLASSYAPKLKLEGDGRLRARLAHPRAGQPAAGADRAERAERARGADPQRRGESVDGDRAGADPHRPGAGPVPADGSDLPGAARARRTPSAACRPRTCSSRAPTLNPLYEVLEGRTRLWSRTSRSWCSRAWPTRPCSRSSPTSSTTELTDLGDQVTYTTYPGVDHGSIPAASETQALAFMEQRLPPG